MQRYAFRKRVSPSSKGYGKRQIAWLGWSSSEFYKVFRNNINLDVLASINYSFEKRQLSICQKRGIITLVPKKDKPTNLLRNLRPISLLNTDYKIATIAIAKWLEAVLQNVINANQTGYIKGCFIGENVRLTSDIINYTATKNLSGFAAFVNFEKAFYSIEWHFLLRSSTYLTLVLILKTGYKRSTAT